MLGLHIRITAADGRNLGHFIDDAVLGMDVRRDPVHRGRPVAGGFEQLAVLHQDKVACKKVGLRVG